MPQAIQGASSSNDAQQAYLDQLQAEDAADASKTSEAANNASVNTNSASTTFPNAIGTTQYRSEPNEHEKRRTEFAHLEHKHKGGKGGHHRHHSGGTAPAATTSASTDAPAAIASSTGVSSQTSSAKG